ncbi:MAG: endonuclease/exonuclease/phosphatase family protein [Deltaproteobacteria bacterium]|nr:endonuclease/exonuclease/phosphatase family protein [Deltaproteobacteria bacterium]
MISLLSIRVATWNVHGFVGTDGRRDPRRTLAVLQELDADVIALQEVDCDGLDSLAAMAALHHEVLLGPACPDRNGFGNAIISRFPCDQQRVRNLTVEGFEPRNVVDVQLRVDSGLFPAGAGHGRLRVLATHFGLDRRERRAQAERLAEIVDDDSDAGGPSDLTVVLGDLNAFDRGESSVAPLLTRFAPALKVRSFPAFLPVMRLDRVLVSHPAVVSVATHRSRLSRTTSDHLPVVGTAVWNSSRTRSIPERVENAVANRLQHHDL